MTTPSPQLAAPLRRNLQQHLLLARRLLRLAQEQTQALIANDPARLSALEQEQRAAIAQQEALEEERQKATHQLAHALGLKEEPKLSALLPCLPASERKAFQQLRQELIRAQEELARVKQQNLALLSNALEYVQFSLESIMRAVFKPSRYGTNLAALAAPALLLDSRA